MVHQNNSHTAKRLFQRRPPEPSRPGFGGAERQPRENLGFRYGPSDAPLKGYGEFIQGSWRSQFLVQCENDLATGQRFVKGGGPRVAIEVDSRQRAIGRSYMRPRRVIVLHRANAALKNLCGVFTRLGRHTSRFSPYFSLVIFSHRGNRLRCNTEKTCSELARRLRVVGEKFNVLLARQQ